MLHQDNSRHEIKKKMGFFFEEHKIGKKFFCVCFFFFLTGNRIKPHRFQVKVQDVVHVGGQGGEESVVGPVGTHLRDNDGPQR